MKELLADLRRWRRQNEEVALATLVAVRGSAPRLPGARLGMTRSTKLSGSVSGGCVENDVLHHAMEVLAADRSALVTYGETVVLVTATHSKPRPGIDFFPLVVDFVEKTSAAGKYLGAGLGADPDFARQMAAWGVQWIHVGCDFEYLRQAANDLFAEIRA